LIQHQAQKRNALLQFIREAISMDGRTLLEVLNDMMTTYKPLDSIALHERFALAKVEEELSKAESGSVEQVCLTVMRKFAICPTTTSLDI
jgi:hypothetical protein